MRPGTAATMIDDPQLHRGDMCRITGAAACWLTRRRDTGHCPITCTPGRLRELIIGGYTAQPVPSEVAS